MEAALQFSQFYPMRLVFFSTILYFVRVCRRWNEILRGDAFSRSLRVEIRPWCPCCKVDWLAFFDHYFKTAANVGTKHIVFTQNLTGDEEIGEFRTMSWSVGRISEVIEEVCPALEVISLVDLHVDFRREGRFRGDVRDITSMLDLLNIRSLRRIILKNVYIRGLSSVPYLNSHCRHEVWITKAYLDFTDGVDREQLLWNVIEENTEPVPTRAVDVVLRTLERRLNSRKKLQEAERINSILAL